SHRLILFIVVIVECIERTMVYKKQINLNYIFHAFKTTSHTPKRAKRGIKTIPSGYPPTLPMIVQQNRGCYRPPALAAYRCNVDSRAHFVAPPGARRH